MDVVRYRFEHDIEQIDHKLEDDCLDEQAADVVFHARITNLQLPTTAKYSLSGDPRKRQEKVCDNQAQVLVEHFHSTGTNIVKGLEVCQVYYLEENDQLIALDLEHSIVHENQNEGEEKSSSNKDKVERECPSSPGINIFKVRPKLFFIYFSTSRNS